MKERKLRFKNALAPKVEEPTAEERASPPGRLSSWSADEHRFEISDRVMFAYFMMYVVGGHIGAYVCFAQAKLATVAFTLFLVIPSMLGLTAGVHRLWSHRAYKVRPPLEMLMVFFYLLANQRSVVTWARTHRLHHQCSDTDADPHNSSRGLFFSHFWWMVVTPHPEVQKRIKHIDVSDLMNNPIIRFQEEHIVPLMMLVTNVIPVYIPTLWGESLYVSVMCNMFRQIVVLHLISSVNSFAHLVGYKPIDTNAVGTQFPLMGILTLGDGFHNYHHTFPIDYKASEFGDTKVNLATCFIEFMAKIGLAYDLKEMSEDVVRNRVLKKGDGSDKYYLADEERTQQQEFCCFKWYKGVKKA